MNGKHKSVIIILVMISLLYLVDLWNVSQNTVDYNIIDGVKGYFRLVFFLGVIYLGLNLIVHIKTKSKTKSNSNTEDN